MSKDNETVLLKAIEHCLQAELPQEERTILLKSKDALSKGHYLPRVAADLEGSLRSRAINQTLSDSCKPLYKLLASHDFRDKGLGIGLMSMSLWF